MKQPPIKTTEVRQKFKSPYTYPHRSRAAMTDYLAEHESYGGWNHPYRRWSPLSWDVKLSPSWKGKEGECKIDESLDDEWRKHCDGSVHLWSWIVEDMQRTYLEGEYCTYPGNDQGDWKFCFSGRSGGHMLLEEWKTFGVSFLKDFSGEGDWREWLESRNYDALKALYRAVRCMDHDFTREKMNKEFEYQLNFRRYEWEEEYRRDKKFEEASEGLEPCPAI